jgi:hypothetical protein
MKPRLRQPGPSRLLLGSLACVWPGTLPAMVGALAKYCSACHGEKSPKGGQNLARLEDQGTPGAWKHVWERVKGRQMPPPDRPQPPGALARKRRGVRLCRKTSNCQGRGVMTSMSTWPR